MSILINWLISAIVIIIAAYVLPGVSISGFGTALVVALVLGFLNMFIKPILLFLTLPINILTLGLFTLVINAFLIWLTGVLVPGFQVSSFGYALLFALILAVIMYLVHIIFA